MACQETERVQPALSDG